MRGSTKETTISTNENKEQPKAKKKSSKKANGNATQGQDITGSFQVDKSSKLNGVEQVAEIQGYNKAPKVVTTEEEFIEAAKQSGVVGFRTVYGVTGTEDGLGDKSSEDICNEYMYQDDIKYNYGGGQSFGEGIYFVTSKSLSIESLEDASYVSWGYGERQMAVTFTPDFKAIDRDSLAQRWDKLADSTKLQYIYRAQEEWALAGHPRKAMTTYAAALGYDGVLNVKKKCDYLVVFNRSKMIMYSKTNTECFETGIHIEG